MFTLEQNLTAYGEVYREVADRSTVSPVRMSLSRDELSPMTTGS